MLKIKQALSFIWSVITLSRWRVPPLEGIEKEVFEMMVGHPAVQSFLDVWAEALRNHEDPADLAASFVTTMQSTEDADERKGLSVLAHWLSVRHWYLVRTTFWKYLTPGVQAAFSLRHANRFYRTFRQTLCDKVAESWETYLAERQAAQKGPA